MAKKEPEIDAGFRQHLVEGFENAVLRNHQIDDIMLYLPLENLKLGCPLHPRRSSILVLDLVLSESVLGPFLLLLVQDVLH